MVLFSACAGKNPLIAIVAVKAAIAVKHAEMKRPHCIEPALGARDAPFRICRSLHMNSMRVARACHRK
jgi:hypothetical protein